jgi:hypothetical protein
MEKGTEEVLEEILLELKKMNAKLDALSAGTSLKDIEEELEKISILLP